MTSPKVKFLKSINCNIISSTFIVFKFYLEVYDNFKKNIFLKRAYRKLFFYSLLYQSGVSALVEVMLRDLKFERYSSTFK